MNGGKIIFAFKRRKYRIRSIGLSAPHWSVQKSTAMKTAGTLTLTQCASGAEKCHRATFMAWASGPPCAPPRAEHAHQALFEVRVSGHVDRPDAFPTSCKQQHRDAMPISCLNLVKFYQSMGFSPFFVAESKPHLLLEKSISRNHPHLTDGESVDFFYFYF